MQNFLDDLRIPQEYGRHLDAFTQEEDELVRNLDSWKTKSAVLLCELASYLATVPGLSSDEQCSLVLHVSAYDGNDSWVSDVARAEAQKISSTFVIPTVPLLQDLLSVRIRPIFQSHLHPNVNPDTGRKLTRPAGGPSALQDLYTSQSWKKEYPGVGNVVLWIVKQITSENYERLWHLIIPPIMILLDDYDSGYKLQGVLVVAEVLKRVPADLLKRTGVDRLFFTSLKSTLTFLNNPKTPDIICHSVPTLVSLINVVAPSISSDNGKGRFDSLSSILGDGIIGSVWMYASRDLLTIKASIDVLPLIIEGLGIGSIRYLKAMIRQLVHLLLPPEPGVELPYPSQAVKEEELKLTALRALAMIIKVCAYRIGSWRGTILDAAARCWIHEVQKQGGSEEIKLGLREVCVGLRVACPSVTNDEFGRLLALDPIFADLL